MIKVQQVSKYFGAVKALDNVNLDIPAGEVVGILGPNGAGKTTLLRLIAGLIYPDTGSIQPTSSSRWPAIGYKQERLLFPNHMRLSAYLHLVAHAANVPADQVATAVNQSLAQVGLSDKAQARIKTCSKGMRQRLAVAQMLLGQPTLLILDEPTNGLDPSGQQEMQQLIHRLHQSGKTVLISSHQLPEIKQVCTRLVILNHGRIHLDKPIAQLDNVPSHIVIETDHDPIDLRTDLQALHPDIRIETTTITLPPTAVGLRRDVIALLLQHDFDVVHVAQHTTSLEDIYAEVVA